jgi:hypothetical protein
VQVQYFELMATRGHWSIFRIQNLQALPPSLISKEILRMRQHVGCDGETGAADVQGH